MRQPGREGLGVGQPDQVAERSKSTSAVEGQQPLYEQTPEQPGQHPHMQEEARAAAHPAGAVRRQAAARDDHVDMGMVGERRAPAVQDAGHAECRTARPAAGPRRARPSSRAPPVPCTSGNAGSCRNCRRCGGGRTWRSPPHARRASVRQASIAAITFSWVRLTCPALAFRHAGPRARKMSASSSAGRGTRPRRQPGPSPCRTRSCSAFICSKGLTVLLIVLVATWA
jgi:hypothetical protein